MRSSYTGWFVFLAAISLLSGYTGTAIVFGVIALFSTQSD